MPHDSTFSNQLERAIGLRFTVYGLRITEIARRVNLRSSKCTDLHSSNLAKGRLCFKQGADRKPS